MSADAPEELGPSSRPSLRSRGSGLLAGLGAALALIGAGALLISDAYGGKPRVEALGSTVAVNAGANDLRDITAHNSPTVVRSPRDPRLLAIANRIDTPRYSCAVHVSSDGGASWRPSPLPVPTGEEPKCYAPDAAFGADGTLYVSFVTLAGLGNVPHAVWISSSHDGGRTLSTPVRVLGPLAFQVRLVADPTVPGRLYLTYLHAAAVALYSFTQPGNPIQVVHSVDGGRTWGPPVRVSDARRARVLAPTPAIGPHGEVYVSYLDIGEDQLDYQGLHQGRGGPPYTGPWSLVLARSRDHGASWEESVVAPRIRPTERFIAFIPPFPSLAVDPGGRHIYAAFQDGTLGDPDVRLWRSSDGGGHWTATRVNDTPPHDGRAQYLPKVAVAPDGRVDVVYYDRRDDPADVRNVVSLQSSFDQGRSFSAQVRLSDRSFASNVGQGSDRGLADLGSRLALLSTDDRALAVWPDTRAGTPTSGKQDLRLSVANVVEPARLAGWAHAALRYGGLAIALLGLGLVGGWALALITRRRRDEAGKAPGGQEPAADSVRP